jgi:hypothetical protein
VPHERGVPDVERLAHALEGAEHLFAVWEEGGAALALVLVVGMPCVGMGLRGGGRGRGCGRMVVMEVDVHR